MGVGDGGGLALNCGSHCGTGNATHAIQRCCPSLERVLLLHFVEWGHMPLVAQWTAQIAVGVGAGVQVTAPRGQQPAGVCNEGQTVTHFGGGPTFPILG